LADSNPPEQFKDIVELSKYAKTMSDIDEMIRFVEVENLKLDPPWGVEDLRGLLNKISTHIRETQPDRLYKQCLEEMKNLVPDDAEDNRFEQVKNFVKCSNILNLHEDEALEIIIKTCHDFDLKPEWKRVIIKLYNRLMGEATNKNSTSNANQNDEEDSTNGSSLPPLEDRLTAYPEHIIKKANEILDTEDPFLYICDTWNECHVGDRNLGEILACSIISTQVLNLAVGIHEKPSGDTESGKSSACIEMGKLCPPWKFRSTTFTPKVLYYMENLLPGTIVYTDDIDLEKPDIMSTVKKVTGEFEYPTVLDTIIDGKAVTKVIPPRVNFWLSSVDTITDEQLGTRFVYSNTEGGTEHNREVNHKQKGKALGKPLEEDKEKTLICRCMFEYICDQLYYVFSPTLFASTWSKESEKRNLEKFTSILSATTVFKYRQRETLHGNLVGTLEDWERAISVYAPVATNNSCLLSDEEILILYSLHEMLETEAYDDGVPHKRLLAYMKETGRFKKSDNTLKRILIGEIGSGKGFKEKVPGFSYEMVLMPKLDEKGLEIIGRGAGHIKTLCYLYNDTLFDGLSACADIEDPAKAHSFKKDRATFENWKESNRILLRKTRNQPESAGISRNPKPVDSGSPSQPILIDNSLVYNNNVGIKESSNNRGGSNCEYVLGAEIDEDTHTENRGALILEKSANSLDSGSTDNDNDFGFRLIPADSGSCILDSGSTDNDNTLDSGSGLFDSEKAPVADGNVHLIPLLRHALIKLAKNEYHSTVLDLDKFTRDFNQRTPEFKKTLGSFPVDNEARKLKIVGWR